MLLRPSGTCTGPVAGPRTGWALSGSGTGSSRDEALIQTMTQALETQSKSETWRRGIGIPYACRWLKNERWKDTTPERSESDQEAEPPRRRYVGKRIIDGQEVDVYE